MEVEHARFGNGVVQNIEGKGNDRKAVIAFKGFGTKNLLLRFAKLRIK
jgi:DNA helicase-2/ATP-dependent DNA helicase PcrA